MGNIDGASKVLQMMKTQGIKVNENIFNSLILGHGEAGDMARSHGMLKVMKQWGLAPSQETYLTLACAYAKQGDLGNVEKVIAESQAQGLAFKDGDFLELVYIFSEGGHKEYIGKLLALTHPETEQFSSMASHLVVRLVNSGHDDVAYNLVQYTVDQSCEEGGTEVCTEFLEQIVRVGRPVAKLLWIVNDMTEKKLLTGGLDRMVDISIRHKNFSLSFKLAEILVSEGGKLDKKNFTELLQLALKTKCDEDLLSCARIAYSCLLDCLCASNEHKKGYEALKEALEKKVALEDINRTALVRLKQGLEDEGDIFPYNIPPKNIKKEFERSLSPVDWNDL